MPTYITSSVANTDGFIPSIWGQEALAILRNNINIAKFCAKDSDFGEGAFATQGQTLTIGYPGTMVPQDKAANTLLTAQVPTGGSATSVTLNKYKVQSFVIENIAQAQSNQDLMQRILTSAVAGLADQVENDLFAAAYSFSRASQGTIGTDITSASLRNAQKTLNVANAPQNDRHLIVSAKDLSALEGDSVLQSYFAFNAGNGVVEAGQFERPLYGMNLHMSNLVPASSALHSVQTLTINGTPTGGTFTLTYAGQTTAAIAYNASAAAVESALWALSSIGTGFARVSGAAGGPYTVVLYVASPVAFTHTDSFTGGSSPALVVADSALVATSNMAMHKNAILLASRPVRPAGGSSVLSAQIVDEVSGLTMNMEAQYNIQAMGLWVNLSILYGVVALRPDQAQVILA
ncbi:MAG: P22 phage major capsid protein family protein [Ktedonobacterales bacterium]